MGLYIKWKILILNKESINRPISNIDALKKHKSIWPALVLVEEECILITKQTCFMNKVYEEGLKKEKNSDPEC